MLLKKRHRADDETNHRRVEVLRGGTWTSIRWKDVMVGDIVKVLNNTFFPADLVLLASRFAILLLYKQTIYNFLAVNLRECVL